MDLNGLSADQAPPISSPARLFLTAPIFGVIAGILIFLSDAGALKSRFSLESIAITHTITIGFLGFVMLGALTQMLPVLAGVSVKRVGIIAKISYIFLLFGTLFMIFGLLQNISNIILISSLFLSGGFLVMIVPMLVSLKSVASATASTRAITTSLIFAFMVIFIGAYLLSGYGIHKLSSMHLLFANIHSVWAVFGFAGVLIIGVSFHVLPMFYVAPKFKPFYMRRVVGFISAGLLLWLILNMFLDLYSIVAKIWIAALFLAFSVAVFLKLNARRRPISDITIWYWKSATLFMAFGSFSWIIDDYFNGEYAVIVSVLIGGGFLLSIMIGMLYKIVPFLVWFHLNAKGYMSIPTMNEMIDKKLTRIQFVLFVLSLAGFVFSFFISFLLPIFAALFIVSMLILEYNIVSPILIYIKILKTKPDFDMSLFLMSTEGKD
ncbi:hypothetical protein [Sulfurimonas sp.]|uniref:hypothetical protein n=1 Tax=Sulfurimonas sp. TaxID=2022749 RepID=UPI0025FECAAB|nr:hypothetical protein [Sulfurimonas sp.]MDD5158309.1 hypothetical protein [Sulfurimonas sp.]